MFKRLALIAVITVLVGSYCIYAEATQFAKEKHIQPNTQQALILQYEGMFIFIMSTPTASFDNLGTVKKTFTLSSKPTEMLNGLIKKSKKEFPQAQGLIISSLDFEQAQVIKFK